jgi:phosphoribosylaminoimidazole-succinocarboxamide synthase
MTTSVYETNLASLTMIHRGKVRDIYNVDEQHMLIVATDRLSAFDVILPTPIAGKGEILTQVSNFWFQRFREVVPNQISDLQLKDLPLSDAEFQQLEHRSVIVKKLKPLPIEAIVRGYLIGSGWKEYQRHQSVCGIALPADIPLAGKLPKPLFTPSTKAALGDHDENIDFTQVTALIGKELAEQVKRVSIELYENAASYAFKRGIIIADTKFEFGLDDKDQLTLIDEALTPDSSRFWPADDYVPGKNPSSFDKQYIRDYLETLDWDKTPPGPALPEEIIKNTQAKYQEAADRLMRSE